MLIYLGIINNHSISHTRFFILGSGKTYTMTGEPQNPGVMPRCLEVIFSSIANFQAKKYIFKPDRMNGFEIQDEEEAEVAARNEMLGFVLPKTPKTPRRYVQCYFLVTFF